MKEHSVIAEMVDRHTGARLFVGDTFTPHDEDQRQSLVTAGCLRDGIDPAVQVRDQINSDGLFERTLDQLRNIARSEVVDLGQLTRKADVIGAIRAARLARGSDKPVYERDELGEKPLTTATRDELLVIAAYEQAEVPQGDAATDPELVAAIEAKRKG